MEIQRHIGQRSQVRTIFGSFPILELCVKVGVNKRGAVGVELLKQIQPISNIKCEFSSRGQRKRIESDVRDLSLVMEDFFQSSMHLIHDIDKSNWFSKPY